MSAIPVVRVCPLCRQQHGSDTTCKQEKEQQRMLVEAIQAADTVREFRLMYAIAGRIHARNKARQNAREDHAAHMRERLRKRIEKRARREQAKAAAA